MAYRKLIVDGEAWSYYVGGTYTVLRAPDGKKKVVSSSTVTGRSPDTFDRGQWKKTSDGMVRPSDVVAYIRKIRK